MLDSPPILALNDTPTPQIPLSASAATSPAHFVPWLKKKKRKKKGKPSVWFTFLNNSGNFEQLHCYQFSGFWSRGIGSPSKSLKSKLASGSWKNEKGVVFFNIRAKIAESVRKTSCTSGGSKGKKDKKVSGTRLFVFLNLWRKDVCIQSNSALLLKGFYSWESKFVSVTLILAELCNGPLQY